MNTRLTKSTMGRLLFTCVLASVVAAMALSTSGNARANTAPEDCGVYTLHGSYLFATNGYNIVGGVAQSKAIVQGIDFNGDGTFVCPFATVSMNGNIIHYRGWSGTYTVERDCTGTLKVTGGSSFDIFAERNGNRLWMIETGPTPAVFEGSAIKVSP